MLAQHGRRLFWTEGKISGPDLRQVSAQPKPMQRQHRIHPGNQHQPALRKGIAQKHGHA
jgi:hypothetical protein